MILSHGHIDHFGLARTVREESGARVYIHEADASKVEDPLAGWEAAQPLYSEFMTKLGVPPEELVLLERMHPYLLTMGRPLGQVERVSEGDTFQFRHFAAKAVHSPGHTPGLCCLYIQSARMLLSGDHILEKVSPNPLIEVRADGQPKFRALATYLRTTEETRKLDIDLVLPGHGGPFGDANRILENLVRFYGQRQAKMLDYLAGGPRSAVELVQHIFPNASRRELNLTISEIVGNIEVLEDRGSVRRLPADPVYRWELAG